MTVRKKATAAGARRVTASLDTLASLFQTQHEALGIPSKVAMDFALRCDLLSDTIEKSAGLRQATFDPNQIGKQVPGPLEQKEPNQAWMAGEFTQQENSELHDKQVDGDMAANAEVGRADPKLASLIAKEATRIALELLGRQAKKAEDSEGDEASDEEDGAAKEASEEEASEEEASEEEVAKKAAQAFGLFSQN